MAYLVEIPPPVREYLNNLMLLGLWHSPISPPINLLLTRIVHQLKLLIATGIDIMINGSK